MWELSEIENIEQEGLITENNSIERLNKQGL